MIFGVEGKFKYKNNGYDEKLTLIIKFKQEGKFFNTRLSRVVSSTTWESSYEHFQYDVISYLTDKDKLETEVYRMIVEHFDKKVYKNNVKKEQNKIKELIKNSKFKIRIKLD